MKLILLLAAVLVVALLVTQQLNEVKDVKAEQAVEIGTDKPPKVPTSPGDVPKFEDDMKKFMADEAAKQAEKIDQATQ